MMIMMNINYNFNKKKDNNLKINKINNKNK